MVAAVGAALRPHLRSAAEFAHGDHQHVVEESVLLEIEHQRGEQMVEQREQRAETLLDPAVGRDVVAVRVPGARGSVVAQVERHEGDARLHEPTGQERLLAPEMFSVPLADHFRLAREVEARLGPGVPARDRPPAVDRYRVRPSIRRCRGRPAGGRSCAAGPAGR